MGPDEKERNGEVFGEGERENRPTDRGWGQIREKTRVNGAWGPMSERNGEVFGEGEQTDGQRQEERSPMSERNGEGEKEKRPTDGDKKSMAR